MKIKFAQIMSLLLAAQLQIATVVRSFLPNATGLAPTAWGVILKLGVGATALLGFDAVSQASSISISPPNATMGTFYSGTISYSGGHSGSVQSMTLTNNCLTSSFQLFPGLTVKYNGGNTATVSGTPTASGTCNFTLKIFSSSCGSGDSDTESTTLQIAPVGGNLAAPSPPLLANTIAQVGSMVQLSGVSTGNPPPQYQWWTGLGTPIVGATNSVLTLTNLQLANAGIYTLTASNSQTAGDSFLSLPKGNCYLTAVISGGTNFTAFDYTNYAPAGVALTMFSFMTNVSTATNYYAWEYNGFQTISTSNTVPLTGTVLTPAKSGTYTVTLNSSNSSGAIVSGQNYDSYWVFGYLPAFTNALPVSTNVNAGSSLALTLGLRGTLNVYNAGAGYQTNNSTPCAFWFQNGTNLVASQNVVLGPTSGTTYTNSVVNATLTLNSVAAANAGNYTLVVTNFWGSLTSSPASLTIASPLSVSTPAGQTNYAGNNLSLSVTAAGNGTLAFQWLKGSTWLANGGNVAGATSNNLSLTPAGVGDSGNYSVIVTNLSGSVTSGVAVVSIVSAPAMAAAFSGGNPALTVNGAIANRTYIVEVSTNLAHLNDWQPLTTNTTPSGGVISFRDTNAAAFSQRFYQLLFP